MGIATTAAASFIEILNNIIAGNQLQAGKEEERQMFQQMQAMAQKQVNTSNALVIRFSVPMSPNKYNNNNNDNSNGNINILICEITI